MSKPERLGDAPIEPTLHNVMNMLGEAIDVTLNGPRPRKESPRNGFVLLCFPFEGREGRCNYISNAKRKDVVILLKEQLARFESMPEAEGRG